jgi:hypothetical protein
LSQTARDAAGLILICEVIAKRKVGALSHVLGRVDRIALGFSKPSVISNSPFSGPWAFGHQRGNHLTYSTYRRRDQVLGDPHGVLNK